MDLIGKIIIVVLLLVIYVEVERLLSTITNCINSKAKKYETETLSIIKKDQGTDGVFNNTNNILSIIDFLIEKEIDMKMHKLSYDEKTYNILKLDDDIKKISGLVFEAISKDAFDIATNATILTKDYILSYITKQTTLMFTQEITKFNITRIGNAVIGDNTTKK